MRLTCYTLRSGMHASDQNAAGPELVGGCYRIEAALGRGGMARVYRVLDERSGQRLALKQLVAEGDQSAALRSMFEHEYHTLVQLAHPCIVRVFDYGLNALSPYYTMEPLEGADAREANRSQALSVRQICVVLRDAASALALIHSRRMVHRDVSPRNLWCTPDGRAKLIDFGTLVAMGLQTQIVGTPPFVPPEAVYMQPLDARSDLYSLGALAYFLLTQRNAYPARGLADLRSLWQRRPKRPDALRPELPRALADLVMALLSLDARGRPASAAEVYDFAEVAVLGRRRARVGLHRGRCGTTTAGRHRPARASASRAHRSRAADGLPACDGATGPDLGDRARAGRAARRHRRAR